MSQQLGQSEVGDFHAPTFVDQDVRRFDVAVNDPFVVRELQGVTNLRHDRQRIAGCHFAPFDCLPQINTFHVFHHEEMQALLFVRVVS